MRNIFRGMAERPFGSDRGDAELITAVAGLVVSLASIFGQGYVADAMYGSGRAASYLEQSGYTNPELQDKMRVLVGVRGCDKTDAVGYEFTATAPNGTPDVDVLVCKGLFKGATVREG